ncbi:oligopeptide ABC transporter oligopeptide-binding protein [Ilumatobacter coccineus YM16-304]|uniref:Oligopeptide ABC transporter oligopeptide-binding protein n=1 Tax=Ilumatobacter coccineus (strain NBRC 103263 / KCTC 29153 / YM16-304) TaxID=1313172 RepID=A0A6C7E9G3_ILUCY|nr:oligopeptide ABC transporter oligopeptide-binding protein [Ilumatobacter coccineus YM16-304]
MQGTSTATRWKRVAAATVSLAVIVGACGGSDSDDSDAEPAATQPESEESTEAPAEESSESETEAGERDPNGILRYAGINAPSRLDPHRSTLSQDNDKLFLALDRLVHQAPNGDPVAGLATEWEFIDDGATLRFTLREGVTFHDGEPFNAEAVKANIERAQTIEGGTQTGDLAVITEVTVVDDYTVDFSLDGPAAALPLILSDRAGAMLSPASFDNPDIDEKPVGAGMYEVVEHNVGSLIVYEAYDGYWDKDAQGLAGVEYHVMSDSGTRSNAIQSGAVDWTIVDNEAYDRLAETDGLEVGLFDDVAYPNQPLNKSREALAIVEVRQAINHAIDREALANVLASGYAVPCSQPWPEGYVAFNEEIGCDYYDYDPEKARELLAEAGYPDGFELELLDTPPSATQRTEAITAMLEAIGIDVTVRELAPGTAGDVWLAQAQGDMLSGVWGGRPDPGQMLALQYGENGFLNPGKHRSDALEAQLLLVNDQNLSAEERAAALQEATRISVEEALDVPLYFPLLANVWSDDVVGAEAYLSGKQEFRGVYIAAAS